MTSVAKAEQRTSRSGPQLGAGGEPLAAQVMPGQPDMWVLVLFEALIFSSYFVVYIIYRMRHPGLFLASQAYLSQPTGVFNTIALLSSSWSVARCVLCAKEGNYGSALNNVYVTILLGLGFTVSKLYEWVVMTRMGLTFSSNEFASFYYFLTGIHLIHVFLGFVVLAVAVYQIKGVARRSQEIIEACATYWHMVDFLWVIIFALLYVMR